MVQPRRVRFVQRLPPPVLIGAAIVGIVVLVVLGVTASADDDGPSPVRQPESSVVPTPIPAAPEGVDAVAWEPDDLGITLHLPSTWEEGEGEEGYELVYEAPDRDRFAFVDRRPITQGRGRVDELERLGATIDGERTVEVAGHDAQVLTYEAPFPGRGIGRAKELDLDLGDGTFAIVVVVLLDAPSDIDGVNDWIVSTVRPA